ncbi:MAG: CHAT domain-containing tetratricopeptide repeat protein [Caldilineaceae bacterium]
MLSTVNQEALAPEDAIAGLLTLANRQEQHAFLCIHAISFDERAAQSLKQRADRLMRSDVQAVLQIAQLLLDLGEQTTLPVARALGLTAEANALSVGGLGNYARAVVCYEEAAAIYASLQRPVDRAKVLAGKVSALAFLGRYTEALVDGQWATTVLQAHEQWQMLAGLNWNLAIVYGRQGDDMRALEKFDQIRTFYQSLGAEGEWCLPMVEQNRAVVLRNLGRFEESITASRRAWALFDQLGQTAELARAQQNLAVTYLVLGRYNEALDLLDQASHLFLRDGRHADALTVELYVTDCLLHLRRFGEGLEKCQSIRTRFAQNGTRLEIGQAQLHEGVALAGLQRYPEALIALQAAQECFQQEDNAVLLAAVEMERAAILLHSGDPTQSLTVSRRCIEVFQLHELPVRRAQACLLAARAALALHDEACVRHMLQQVFAISDPNDIPTLAYQGHYLLGDLCKQMDDIERAQVAYGRAIQELERLRGNLMVEFRADFLADKQTVYEDMVDLCLARQAPAEGFTYAERAKSRALLDLLAHRVDLRIQAKDARDERDVAQLMHLRQERDRLYRRWEGRANLHFRGANDGGVPLVNEEQQQILTIEKQITALWHKLLVHNADYARDAALWQVYAEPVQSYLPEETLLIEYFSVRGTLVVFLVSRHTVQAIRLPTSISHVLQLTQLLGLNLRAVMRSGARQMPDLTQNALGLLQQLYRLLVAPYAIHLNGYKHLQVVPHGPLHYLPFHALHDGQQYLLEAYEVSYLTGADLLRYRANDPAALDRLATNTVALGHSFGKRLPHTVAEAQRVAHLTGGQALVDSAATTSELRSLAATCRILHFATHGDFRNDNPLFSGLALDDGWLTTLDVFHLRLNASLVTLSACQTGRHVIGGGDELLGLLRAFLYAGANSLVATLWSVEDHSTATLMERFYAQLMGGATKGAALRHAQLAYLADGDRHAHPFFWAPFFLVGHAGAL